jgi:hypothetical protein
MGVAELLALPFIGDANAALNFRWCCLILICVVRCRAQTVPATLFLLLINAVWILMIFIVFFGD